MYFANSDAFGPKVKSENIPGTPMEQADAMMLSDTTETNSTSNSSFINEINDQLSHTSQLPRRTSLDLTPDANHTNLKNANNYANKDRYWSRPSISPSEDGSSKRRPSKQDKEVRCTKSTSADLLTLIYSCVSCVCVFFFKIPHLLFVGNGPRIVNVS